MGNVYVFCTTFRRVDFFSLSIVCLSVEKYERAKNERKNVNKFMAFKLTRR